MEGTPRLYETLVQVLGQHETWLDRRHLQTLAWMVVGLIPSGNISLTAWVPQVHSRAMCAQSTVRRVTRWLEKERSAVHPRQGPLIQQAMAAWGDPRVYLALDTAMLWHTSCVVRLSLVYRGRAIPLVWTVLEHSSSRVAYHVYQELLDQVAERLPGQCPVVLTAERGFAETPRMAHLARLGWPWRIRINGSFWGYRHGPRRGKVNRLP